jgi:tryptophan synthase alpha chain
VKKLIGYITAGILEDNATSDLIMQMKENGLDGVELGIPFSDPVADGPIIETASQIALKNGFKFQQVFTITKSIDIDVLWMGYFNPFYQKDIKNILKKAKDVGVSGFIIPDLPYEEARNYKKIFEKYNIALIDFIAPTDSKDRIQKIVENSRKFIYLVAYAGITGSNKKENLKDIVKNIRLFTKTPIYVGFGVNKNTAKERAKNVDGVIVGSAFMKILIDESLTVLQKIDKIASLTKEIKVLINE